MITFLSKRLLQLIPVLWGVGTIVFLLLHFVPGDPVEIMLGEHAIPASKEKLRADLGLDRPLPVQYLQFWKNLFQGDLGNSLLSKEPVAKLIIERMPATISLTFLAMLWATCLAIPLGTVAAAYKNTAFDKGVLLFSILGVCVPSFWLGPLLVLFFSVKLGWFPVSEREGITSYILPAFTLGLGLAAVLTRMTRASMAEILSQDYITTAKSKGLPPEKIYLKHALKNALIPVITILGLQLGGLLAGALITETIFDWPGLGELVFRAIQSRDFPLVQGCVLVIATIYVFVNSLADIFYSIANPRIVLK
jgi:peptide/nickel transport system permease protein